MIETKRLKIRKFTEEDYQDLYEYLSLPLIYKYEPGEPINITQAKELAVERSKANDFWAVVLFAEKKMIGHLYFKQIEPLKYMTWEFGFIFSPKYWRKGYAKEAAKAFLEYAFNKYNTHRVVAHCNPDNMASWKLLESVGMRREGFFKKDVFFRKDAKGVPLWFDSYTYAILKEEVVKQSL